VIQFGGKYGPTYTAFFEEQNQKKSNGAIPIYIETLGIINGCTDMLSQASYYPDMAYNNTYGLQTITADQYEIAKLNYTQPGGCQSLTETCRALATELDPNNYGNVPSVNDACSLASNYCADYVAGPYLASGVCAFPSYTKRKPFI